jgi:hypothetical protein
MRHVRLLFPIVLTAVLVGGCGGGSEKSNKPSPAPTEGGGAAPSSKSTPSGQTVRLTVQVKPAPVNQITFRAQHGFKLNAREFPSCDLSDLKAGRLAACKKATVGDGRAQVISPKGKTLTSKISTFNGGAHGASTTFLYYVRTPGYSAIPAAATVKKLSAGSWGYAITYPPISKALPVAKLDLRTLDKTVKSGGRTVHLIETPASCGGSWKFDSRTSFRSGERLTIAATVPCSS